MILLQVLVEAEQREQRLVGAEESLARRRKEAEREHKAALADAQASVRRLQVPSTCMAIIGRPLFILVMPHPAWMKTQCQ